MATRSRKRPKLAKEIASWENNFYRPVVSENLVPVQTQFIFGSPLLGVFLVTLKSVHVRSTFLRCARFGVFIFLTLNIRTRFFPLRNKKKKNLGYKMYS